MLAPLGIRLVVNDRLDIAMAIDADGVHVGQTDLPVEAVRRLAGPGKIVGLSITNATQILQPDAAAADISASARSICSRPRTTLPLRSASKVFGTCAR